MATFITIEQFNNKSTVGSFETLVEEYRAAVTNGDLTPEELMLRFNDNITDTVTAFVGSIEWESFDLDDEVFQQDRALMVKIGFEYVMYKISNSSAYEWTFESQSTPDGLTISRDQDRTIISNITTQKFIKLMEQLSWFKKWIGDDDRGAPFEPPLLVTLPDNRVIITVVTNPDVNNLSEWIVNIENQIIIFNQAITALQSKDASQDVEIANLQNEVDALETQVTALYTRLDDFRGQGVSLETQFNDVENLAENNQANINTIQEILAQGATTMYRRYVAGTFTQIGEIVNEDFDNATLYVLPGVNETSEDVATIDNDTGVITIKQPVIVTYVVTGQVSQGSAGQSPFNTYLRTRELTGAIPNPAVDPLYPNAQEGEFVAEIDFSNQSGTFYVPRTIVFQLNDDDHTFPVDIYGTFESDQTGYDFTNNSSISIIIEASNRTGGGGATASSELLNDKIQNPNEGINVDLNKVDVHDNRTQKMTIFGNFNQTNVSKPSESSWMGDIRLANQEEVANYGPVAAAESAFYGITSTDEQRTVISRTNYFDFESDNLLFIRTKELPANQREGQVLIATPNDTNIDGTSIKVIDASFGNPETILSLEVVQAGPGISTKATIDGLTTDDITSDKKATNKRYVDDAVPPHIKFLRDEGILNEDQYERLINIYKEHFKAEDVEIIGIDDNGKWKTRKLKGGLNEKA